MPATHEPAAPARRSITPPGAVLAGYLFALTAGALWGTTGPLSTALYGEGAEVTDVGFWRILLATVGFVVYGVLSPAMFRIDRRGLLLVGGVGGVLVALFELAYQFAIAGAGVASAVALLYVAPVLVTLLARPLLGESATPGRMGLAVVVMIGAGMTVIGARDAEVNVTALGVLGGLGSALSYAGTTLLARFAVPRYGAVRVLFYELAGGTLILALLLPLVGHTPQPAGTAAGWIYILALGGGTVLANFAFFAGVRRIDAAPAAVAATAEPVVAALLAWLLFAQGLTLAGWLGLLLVVTGVAGGYARESGAPGSGPSGTPAPGAGPG